MSDALAGNIYFTATGEEDGRPVIYRSMQSVPDGESESDYPNLVNVYWAFDVEPNNGMPDRDSNDKQIAFEDALADLDVSGTSHLMLVVTGNGRKEWIWYVKDVERWLEKLNSLLAGTEVYPIEIETSHDPEWAAYHHFVAAVKGL
ncbi:DUF695 domain-containing protein [Atopomonas hussainii]|uniref:DUF695 domain-containing protein n=1 Tax=Atopomonas hussainii TaxID=1429083 RepID=UPI001587F28E|nr:DUF695 domain-containing protein [Atopomonas hussainii]